ncbi:MAG TPA: hypothetical protein VD996_16180, partial [Chitinophagaceae bacterium]|nr:hypothetical protein [Chitinophagaceae bacterium]
MGNDATRFCKRIPIRAGIQEIYNAWTIPAELEKWFLRKATFTSPDGRVKAPSEPAAKGDQYHWLWHGYGDDMYEDRPVLDANGRDLFSFMFSGECVVKVHIKAEEGETICEL